MRRKNMQALHIGGFEMSVLPGFFAALPNADKQMIVVPNSGHAMTLVKQRYRFYSEVGKWFSIE